MSRKKSPIRQNFVIPLLAKTKASRRRLPSNPAKTPRKLTNVGYKVFARARKAGGCAASQCEAIGELISLAWRKGATAEEVVDQLKGISCQLQDEKDPERADSCADGVAMAIKVVEALRESGTASQGHEKGKPAKEEE